MLTKTIEGMGEKERRKNIVEDKKLARWVRKHNIIGSTTLDKIRKRKEVTL
jgi:hypothetical protein